MHQDAPVNLAAICVTVGIKVPKQLDPNNPQRYQISLSVPN